MEAFEDPLAKIPAPINQKWDNCNSQRSENDTLCGLGPFKPKWIQRFATKTYFIALFSIISIINGMAWSYFSAVLTTLEKRLRISSKTSGIIMTGNEISQILFAIILSYYGGNGHKPRWMSVGVGLSALSCFLLASPHFFYGPGDEALSLTEEYYYSFHEFHNHSHFLHERASGVSNFSAIHEHHNNGKNDLSKKIQRCEPDSEWTEKNLDCGAGEKSVLPLILIFMSQFVAGIGGVLLTTLGGPFIDDNVEQVEMPLILGITLSLRLVGPLLGYALAYFCLKTYISPTLSPYIGPGDPRWMGAWWAGWVFLGTVMAITSFIISLFPRELRRDSKPDQKNSYSLQDTNGTNAKENGETQVSKSTISDLFGRIKALSKNKINMYNNLSIVCYLFGVMGFGTYIHKYIQTIFKVSSSSASVIPAITIGGQAIGFVISGFVMSKYKPSTRKLAGLNVTSELIFLLTLVAFTQFKCHQGSIVFGTENPNDKTWNLTESCNAECNCDSGQMVPVCFREQKRIYYSACHAGCTVVDNSSISNCSCLPSMEDSVELGTCTDNCFPQFIAFLLVGASVQIFASFGRIGSMLIALRCVHPKQKPLSFGVTVFLTNLFANLPSPIIFGAIIDGVCLVWGTKCAAKGNCLMYDRDKLVYVFNLTAAVFVLFGLIFNAMVFYHVKDLDLYDETKNHHLEYKAKTKKVVLS